VVWQASSNVSGVGEVVQVHAHGGVTLVIDGNQWLGESTPTACIGGSSAFTGFVNVTQGRATTGTDPRLGPFKQFQQTITFPAALHGTMLFTRFYPKIVGSAAFEFSVKLSAAVVPGKCDGAPVIGFPFGGKVLQPAAVLTWRGEMAAHSYSTTVAHDTGAGTAPLVLVGKGGTTVLVAPADEFLTTGVMLKNSSLIVGPQSTLVGLPAGYIYTVSAALSSNRGVTRTVKGWGDTLQQKYNANAQKVSSNPLNELLSYTTALGEYYDYLDWPNITSEGTPQDTLLNISQNFRAADLPIKVS
jgi:hypothetical protein